MALPFFNTEARLSRRLRHIRLIACDLDGTLLTNENEIPEPVHQLIEELARFDVHVILLSGRSDGFIRGFAQKIPGKLPVISLNGALAKAYSGDVLHSAPVEVGVGELMLDHSRNHPGTVLSAFTSDGIYSLSHIPTVPRYLRPSKDEYRRVEFMEPLFSQTVQYVLSGSYKTVQDISIRIVKSFKRNHERMIYQSNQGGDNYYMEVRRKNVDKRVALKSIASQLGYQRKHIAAIGDFANDFEMLKYASVAGVMQNGMSELKKHADFITTSDNNAGGIKEFFELILEQKEKL